MVGAPSLGTGVVPARQVVDLRHPMPVRAQAFADSTSRGAYLARLEAARRQQGSQYAVAPECFVVLPDGTRLDAGRPVDAAALGARLLRQHLGDGRVIERYDLPSQPAEPGA